jgi:ribosomal-protein-alanine N-acetyltransferase
MTVEAAERKHAALIHALEAQTFSDPWSEQAILSHMEAESARTLIALCEGAVVGYLLGSVILPESELYRIAVAPSARRQGVGKALLENFLEQAPICFLEVRKSNGAARALYEKNGFRLIGERPRYYKNPTEDACIYKREA